MDGVLYDPNVPDMILKLNSSTQITIEIEIDPTVKDPSASLVPYIFNQVSPSASWVIAHNLGYKPDVTVYSTGGLEVTSEVLQVDDNNLTINFSTPFTGRARLF